ncbi:hypothetical protein Peur_001817 [Populus x canadensis]
MIFEENYPTLFSSNPISDFICEKTVAAPSKQEAENAREPGGNSISMETSRSIEILNAIAPLPFSFFLLKSFCSTYHNSRSISTTLFHYLNASLLLALYVRELEEASRQLSYEQLQFPSETCAHGTEDILLDFGKPVRKPINYLIIILLAVICRRDDR